MEKINASVKFNARSGELSIEIGEMKEAPSRAMSERKEKCDVMSQTDRSLSATNVVLCSYCEKESKELCDGCIVQFG